RKKGVCLVCGDHATGYNFNVITCESCKAFFRRNANKPKGFKCAISDDCEVNILTRRLCQSCRMNKCLIVGMQKDWILNEDQLMKRKNSRVRKMAKQAAALGDQRARGRSVRPPSSFHLTAIKFNYPSAHSAVHSMAPILSPLSTLSAFSNLSPTDSSCSESLSEAKWAAPLSGSG
ncbi:hypothetical protein PENTCL1PPCAC_449, partial [Pristionchus entomophagus]